MLELIKKKTLTTSTKIISKTVTRESVEIAVLTISEIISAFIYTDDDNDDIDDDVCCGRGAHQPMSIAMVSVFW